MWKSKFGYIGILLLFLFCTGSYRNSVTSEAKEQTRSTGHTVYDKDSRLEPIETDQGENWSMEYLFQQDQYTWILDENLDGYDESVIAESTHASFDEKNRLRYALG